MRPECETPGGCGQELESRALSVHWPTGLYLAKVYKSPYDRQKDRDGTLVRVIRYALNDPQRVGHGEVHVLITKSL